MGYGKAYCTELLCQTITVSGFSIMPREGDLIEEGIDTLFLLFLVSSLEHPLPRIFIPIPNFKLKLTLWIYMTPPKLD